MFLQCQVSMSTTAPAPVGHGSLTITRPRGTCLGLATRVWRHVACAGRGVTGLDWTGFYSVLLCSELIHLLLARTGPAAGVWVALSLRRLRPSWPGQHQTYGGPQLHPFITRLADMLDQCSVHQPRYLDVTVASPCLFIFIQLA